MRRRKNKIIAGTVVAVMMAGSIMANISPLIASQTGANSVAASETFNKEGLWITEIYQNDVDRSEKNNTREKSGYESIKLYKSTTDLMEFVEITSTYDKAVNFNDTYEFVYDDTVQKVTTMDGNDEVIIQPEEKLYCGITEVMLQLQFQLRKSSEERCVFQMMQLYLRLQVE